MKKLALLFLIALFLFNCNNEIVDIQEEVLCDNGTFVGDVTLLNQQEVDDFGALCFSRIEGNIYINEPAIGVEINSLKALSALTEVAGGISISSSNLETLKGLENLSFVEGGFSLTGMHSLVSLIDLEKLESVGYLKIQHSELITSLNGLESLRTLNGLGLHNLTSLNSIEVLLNVTNSIWDFNIQIENCPLLTSLSGLENVTFTWRVNLYRNKALTSLDGLQNLTNVNQLIIDGCDSLINLEGLNSIENTLALLDNDTYFISIFNNSSLISLKGLENLMHLNWLYIGSPNSPNMQLLDLCALQNVFTNGTYDVNHVNIENNAFNPTVQDLIDGNCSQ